ncbi:MAG: hypothetical protein E6R09_07470 [Rhodocyclaceae bacterium]|jgi:hypothetical protein|nr:MAG: hypothetical protein E6R09_07470 [Rhodocyclaceae bacterium]
MRIAEYIQIPDLLAHPVLLIFLVAANWPLYRRFMQVLFGSIAGLGEAIRFWFIPDLYSYLTNRYFEDKWAELRLFVWLSLCAGCVVSQYAIVTLFLDWWYANVICCAPTA